MGRTFVMGDIHGMYKAFLQCLERSGFDNEKDKLIQLGDVADRGPELYECVEALLGIKNLVSIKGNHDEAFEHWLLTGAHTLRAQGGADAIQSYVQHCEEDLDYMNDTKLQIPKTHRDFFTNQLPWYMDDDKNIFVHGGMNRHMYLVEHKDPHVFWWDRDLWHSAMSYEAVQKGLVYSEPGGNVSTFKIKEPCKEVFIGHTPTLLWSKSVPMHASNVWNMDTGAGMSGRLTIMDIETKEFWQSDFVNMLYPPYATFEPK